MKTLKKDAPQAMELKTDEGIIEGYASVFNKVDSYGDTIDPKAYDHVVASGELPTMLFGHDASSLPIGKWLEMSVDEKGLKVKGQLNLNNARAKEVYDAVKFGALTGMSVNIAMSHDDFDEKEDGGYLIKNVQRLHEISVVSLPADNFARISECKSFEEMQSIKDLEIGLRDAGLSRNQAKAFIAVAKRVLPNQRDVETKATDADMDVINSKIHSILNKMK